MSDSPLIHKKVAEPDAGLPSYYFNSFEIGFGNADFELRLRLNQTDLASLRMSYTVAKTLSEKLSVLVKEFEKITGHQVMTTDEIHEAMRTHGTAPS